MLKKRDTHSRVLTIPPGRPRARVTLFYNRTVQRGS
jgi:hypothetical protein